MSIEYYIQVSDRPGNYWLTYSMYAPIPRDPADVGLYFNSKSNPNFEIVYQLIKQLAGSGMYSAGVYTLSNKVGLSFKATAWYLAMLRKHGLLTILPVDDLTQPQWSYLVNLYEGRCAYCGQLSEGLIREHVIPVSRGGRTNLENIVPACRRCNSLKGTKTVEELLRLLGLLD